MPEAFLSDWGVIIALLVGLAGLGTYVSNIIKGYNKRQDEKEAARIKKEAEKEAVIKKDLEIRGEQIKNDAIKTAEGVKTAVEARANIIKEEVSTTARLLKEHNQLLIDNVLTQIKEVDEKLMKMLEDLSTRADMTNGNVKDIRLEIQAVKENVELVWDRLDETDQALGTEEKIGDVRRRRKREQEFDRRRKRKEIEDTADEQEREKRQYAR